MSEGRIVLAGGGSAGHVNPLLATARELESRGFDPVILGTVEGLESDLVPAAGFQLITVPKVPLPRGPSTAWFSFPGQLNEAINISIAALQGASALVGFGGYVSTPAYLAARRVKMPVVIHEQNVRPGLANRLGARWAAAVALTFAGTQLKAKNGRTEVTGLPLRQAISELSRQRQTVSGTQQIRRQGATELGLDPDRLTLLVTGGSLGAQHLNEVVAEAISGLPQNVQILHLTGRGKSAMFDTGGINSHWVVLEYLEAMEKALAVADLVLCRSGAGTVAELSALGIPAIYVPLPIGNGEQRLNGASVVAAGGALMVDDADFSVDTMRDLVIPTILNGAVLSKMSAAALRSSVGNGTESLADLVEEVCRR